MATAQIFTPAVGAGDATGEHTIQLWRALQPRFETVAVYSFYPPGPLPGEMSPFVRQVNAEHRSQADLTIVQYPLWYPLAERVRDLAGRKLLWYHGVTPPELWGSTRDSELLRNSQIRTALAWHTHLAAVTSPYTARELHDLSGLPEERIRTVPLGLDGTRFAEPPSPAELQALRDRWQLDDRRVLLYVGRIAGNKRIDLLIDAAARLRGDHPDIKLLLVGDGDYNQAAKDLVAQLRQQLDAAALQDHVAFTGRVPEIAPFLHLADLFILPSAHEGFGLPLVEAMHAGTPVLASASGAMPWVTEADGARPAGLIFTPGDAADLARQAARLLEDDELRSTLIRNGRARAATLSLGAFDANTLRVVDDVMTLEESDTAFNAMVGWTLYPQADTMLRDYEIRSNAPLFASFIERVRRNLTSHLKEPYVDRVFERQVRYNRLLSTEIEYLHAEMRRLEARMARLQAARDVGPGAPDDVE